MTGIKHDAGLFYLPRKKNLIDNKSRTLQAGKVDRRRCFCPTLLDKERIMKAKILIIVLSLIACGVLLGQTSHDEAARRFFRLNTPESEIGDMLSENFDSILSIFIDGLREETDLNIDTGDRESMRELLSFILDLGMDYDKIEQISIPLIKSQFSLNELNSLNEFFSTKAGTKYLDLYVLNNTNYLSSAFEQIFNALSEDEDMLEQVVNKIYEIYGLNPEDFTPADTLDTPEPDDYYNYNDDDYNDAYPDTAVVSDEDWPEEIDIEALQNALIQLSGETLVSDNRPSEHEFIPYDDPPVIVGTLTPIYPEFARKAGIQGTVVLEVEVYKDGTVGEIRVKRSVQSGPGSLDEEAIAAIRRVKFQPGIAGGKPVDTLVIIPIEFKLH